VKDLGIFLDIIGVSLSGGIRSGLLTMHLSCSMVDYSLANKEIKCVPTLYLITYNARYYD
jgi:hypothetical protein